jgi:superfamily II DNA or RNA helicase
MECPKTLDWPSAYQKGIVENKARNKAVVEIVKANHVPTLIIIKDVKNGHGELLKEEIEKLGRTVASISGSSKDRQEHIDALDAGKLDVLIATAILNEGVSIKNIHMLIVASGGKALTETTQRIGRALRKMDGKESVLVIDFKDHGNKYTMSHSTQRRYIYEKIGFKDVEDLTLEEFLRKDNK